MHFVSNLNNCLCLSKHSGGIQHSTVLCRHVIRNLPEHVNLLIHGYSLPVSLGLQGHVNGLVDELRGGPVEFSNLLLVVMGLKQISNHSMYSEFTGNFKSNYIRKFTQDLEDCCIENLVFK